ncbi:hypothetical protein Cni_G07700 [Canna indica]|uniref:Uncharacterized protein n=1 Tax=Canna indica TaxID=4628 RepID=A0AAQ3JZ72_9LILI|nr:hypothetical protein Cni_G07700 [Canna indica]
MAGRLSSVASRLMGGNGVAARSAASALRSRSGMGLPVGKHIVPDKPVNISPPIFFFSSAPFFLPLKVLIETVLVLSAACSRRVGLGQRYAFPGTLRRSPRAHHRKGASILLI